MPNRASVMVKNATDETRRIGPLLSLLTALGWLTMLRILFVPGVLLLCMKPSQLLPDRVYRAPNAT